MPRMRRPPPAFTFADDGLNAPSLRVTRGHFVAELPIPAGLAARPVGVLVVGANQQQPEQLAVVRYPPDDSPFATYVCNGIADRVGNSADAFGFSAPRNEVPEIVRPCLQLRSQSIDSIRRHRQPIAPFSADPVPYPQLLLRHEQPLRYIHVSHDPVALRHRQPADPAILLVLELPVVERRSQFQAEFPRLLCRTLQGRLVVPLPCNVRPRSMHHVWHGNRLLAVFLAVPRHPTFHHAMWAFDLNPRSPLPGLDKRTAPRQHRQLGAQSVKVVCLRRKPPRAVSNGVGHIFRPVRRRELARFPVDQAYASPTLRHGPGPPHVRCIVETRVSACRPTRAPIQCGTLERSMRLSGHRLPWYGSHRAAAFPIRHNAIHHAPRIPCTTSTRPSCAGPDEPPGIRHRCSPPSTVSWTVPSRTRRATADVAVPTAVPRRSRPRGRCRPRSCASCIWTTSAISSLCAALPPQRNPAS